MPLAKWAFKYACLTGNVQTAEWWCQRFKVSITPKFVRRGADLFQQVCGHGHLGMAQWLHANFLNDNDVFANGFGAARSACEYGQLHVLQWMDQQRWLTAKNMKKSGALLAACANGQAAIVNWLFNTKRLFGPWDVTPQLLSFVLHPYRYNAAALIKVFACVLAPCSEVVERYFLQLCRDGNIPGLQRLVTGFNVGRNHLQLYDILTQSADVATLQWVLSHFAVQYTGQSSIIDAARRSPHRKWIMTHFNIPEKDCAPPQRPSLKHMNMVDEYGGEMGQIVVFTRDYNLANIMARQEAGLL